MEMEGWLGLIPTLTAPAVLLHAHMPSPCQGRAREPGTVPASRLDPLAQGLLIAPSQPPPLGTKDEAAFLDLAPGPWGRSDKSQGSGDKALGAEFRLVCTGFMLKQTVGQTWTAHVPRREAKNSCQGFKLLPSWGTHITTRLQHGPQGSQARNLRSLLQLQTAAHAKEPSP